MMRDLGWEQLQARRQQNKTVVMYCHLDFSHPILDTYSSINYKI